MDGFLILDKPQGITSAHAVAKVKRLLKPKKIGHGGTLDPLATGILPMGIGKATKLLSHVMGSRKTYQFTITWGESRDTDDAEGQVTATTDNIPTREAIEAALPAFIGEIMQAPPVYSAIKVDGKRAYDLARAGELKALPPRPVMVYSLKIIGEGSDQAGTVTLEMDCGKGTYVRSIARDLAIKLNSLGYISMLRRTRVGNFSEKDAISLEKLAEMVHIGVPSALDDILVGMDNLTSQE